MRISRNKLKNLKKIYPVRNNGIQMRRNKKLEKLLKLYFPSRKRLVSNGVYSQTRDEFKLSQKPDNTSRRPESSVIKRIIAKGRDIISGAKLLCASTQSLKRISGLFRSLAPVKRKTIIKKALALATIIVVIITAYFQNTSQVSAAT